MVSEIHSTLDFDYAAYADEYLARFDARVGRTRASGRHDGFPDAGRRSSSSAAASSAAPPPIIWRATTRPDVVLLEQGKLTCGSTWHAAGLVGQLRSSASITQVLKYSVELYKRLEAETGLATGWKMTGCLRLACQRRSLDRDQAAGDDGAQLRPGHASAFARRGEDAVAADGRRGPRRRLLPADRRPGQARPTSRSRSPRARACTARSIIEDVRVTGFEMKDGRIARRRRPTRAPSPARRSSTAPGNGRGRSARMAGINVPLQPVKHQYHRSPKSSPGCRPTLPTLRDPDRRTYFKEEVGGLVMGGYEPNPIAWTTRRHSRTTSSSSSARRRLGPFRAASWSRRSRACRRSPTAGVKQMINGPESFTPDGNFILGAAPECANMYRRRRLQRLRHRLGRRRRLGAGAMGRCAAKPPIDLWVVDIRRFSAPAPRPRLGARRARSKPMASTTRSPSRMRNMRAAAAAHRLAALRSAEGARRRASARSSAGSGRTGSRRRAPSRDDVYSMGRQNWFDAVGDEHRAGARARRRSSTSPPSPNSRSAARTPQTALDWICANDVDKPVGRLTYTQMLNSRGGIECDLTVARLARRSFLHRHRHRLPHP